MLGSAAVCYKFLDCVSGECKQQTAIYGPPHANQGRRRLDPRLTLRKAICSSSGNQGPLTVAQWGSQLFTLTPLGQCWTRNRHFPHPSATGSSSNHLPRPWFPESLSIVPNRNSRRSNHSRSGTESSAQSTARSESRYKCPAPLDWSCELQIANWKPESGTHIRV